MSDVRAEKASARNNKFDSVTPSGSFWKDNQSVWLKSYNLKSLVPNTNEIHVSF